MALQRRAVGIDIGSHAVKAVQLRVSGSEARVEASAMMSRDRLAASGVDANDPKALAEALRAGMDEAGISSSGAVLAIDGQESIIRYTHMPPMPSKRLETVMSYEVESVADRMGEAVASDYVILPVRREDGEQTILLGLTKEEGLANLLTALEEVGVTVSSAVPAPLGLFGAWEIFGEKDDPDSEKDDVLLLLDVGARNLHLALVLNNRLLFARSGSFGGMSFTEGLAKARGISLPEAERLKIDSGGLSDAQPGVDPQVAAALRSVAGQLVGIVQSSLRYCGAQTGVAVPSVSRIWLTGGGSRLRGMDSYLSTSLGNCSVGRFEPAAAGAGGDGDGGSEAGMGLAVGLASVGLRSSGAEKTPVSMNVLPAAYKGRREFRERTVWLWAAAGILALLLVVRLTHGLFVRADAFELHGRLESALTQLLLKEEEQKQAESRSGESKARMQRMLREAELTSFQAFVLSYLAETLRPEIQLQRVHLDVEEAGEESGFEYTLVIEGRVSDEKNRGADWILELREKLLAEDRVGDVQVLDEGRRDPWYTFKLAIRPGEQRI